MPSRARNARFSAFRYSIRTADCRSSQLAILAVTNARTLRGFRDIRSSFYAACRAPTESSNRTPCLFLEFAQPSPKTRRIPTLLQWNSRALLPRRSYTRKPCRESFIIDRKPGCLWLGKPLQWAFPDSGRRLTGNSPPTLNGPKCGARRGLLANAIMLIGLALAGFRHVHGSNLRPLAPFGCRGR